MTETQRVPISTLSPIIKPETPKVIRFTLPRDIQVTVNGKEMTLPAGSGLILRMQETKVGGKTFETGATISGYLPPLNGPLNKNGVWQSFTGPVYLTKDQLELAQTMPSKYERAAASFKDSNQIESVEKKRYPTTPEGVQEAISSLDLQGKLSGSGTSKYGTGRVTIKVTIGKDGKVSSDVSVFLQKDYRGSPKDLDNLKIEIATVLGTLEFIPPMSAVPIELPIMLNPRGVIR